MDEKLKKEIENICNDFLKVFRLAWKSCPYRIVFSLFGENKDIDKSGNDTKYYIEFSNDKMKNKIYVNKGVYDNCKLGDETKVSVKDIYDKKGNILKEELLFDIID